MPGYDRGNIPACRPEMLREISLVSMVSMCASEVFPADYRDTTTARVRHLLRLQLTSHRPAGLVYQPLSVMAVPPCHLLSQGDSTPCRTREFSAFLESDSRL